MRLCAAGIAVASALTFAPTTAQAATCTTLVNLPATTVIVAGQPVATVPAIFVALCGEISVNPASLPTVRIEQNSGDPTIFAVFLDVPADFHAEDLRLRVAIDGTGTDIPIPVGISGPSSTCVLFRGPAWANPGGCLVGLQQG